MAFPDSAVASDLPEKRRKAEAWVNGYTATGSAAVLPVSLIPGAATAVLCGIEATMCYHIGALYRGHLTMTEARAAAAAVGLAAVAGNIAALEATIILGPFAIFAKPLIAAGIIKALGKLVIKHFEDTAGTA